MTTRRAELAGNLAAVRARLAAACVAARRDPDDVTLVAVTKTFPSADVRLLAELGVADVAENRDQEAAPKHAECAGLPLRWHFVGQLQRNKARSVASYADVVHSADRVELVHALAAAAARCGRVLEVLVQVALDETERRGGAVPELVPELARRIDQSPALYLGGVMAVAPLGADPDVAFARLAAVAAVVRAQFPHARAISAGMSGDLEAAIRHGATHVRVGTALLGQRTGILG